MIDKAILLELEVLRQKNLKRIERQRKFRNFQPERFNEFQFAKFIGYDKAMQRIIYLINEHKEGGEE